MGKLTNQQRTFAREYVQCWSATEAAKRAGYSEKSAHVNGPRLLGNASVKAEVQRLIDDRTMGAEEALTRLGEQSRAEYAEYISDDGTVDLAAMKRDGKMHLVKGIKYTRAGDKVVEFHDAQAALFKVVSVLGLQVERSEVRLEIDDTRAEVRSRIDSLAARLRAGRGDDGASGDAGSRGGTGA
jgi:phage terminase small subunit